MPYRLYARSVIPAMEVRRQARQSARKLVPVGPTSWELHFDTRTPDKFGVCLFRISPRRLTALRDLDGIGDEVFLVLHGPLLESSSQWETRIPWRAVRHDFAGWHTGLATFRVCPLPNRLAVRYTAAGRPREFPRTH